MKPDNSHSGLKATPAPHSAEAIESEAADWLALRAYRPFTQAEQAAFETWLAADSRHAAVVTELESAWRALDGLAAYPRQAGDEDNPEFFTRPRPFRRMRWLAVGAAAAIAFASILKFHPWSRSSMAHDGTSPSVAQQDDARILRLPDGSLVELRPGSEVAEQFVATERRVRLIHGEAYFTVAKNPTRPFIVDAGGVAVRAVGTAFNVRLDPASVVVLVTEGKVKVNPPGAPTPALPAGSVAEAHLFAGQRTVVTTSVTGIPTAPVVETVSATELEQALAWQGSKLVFDSTPLSQVVAQFNRRNARRLVIGHAELGALRISGRFRADNFDGFAELMESSFGIVITRRGDDILLGKTP
ncbi:MAG: FecR domain-containing protein [Opitutaceae bacterium]|nr:FecR domain-containing protein [Opitutaceae bacterium]